MLRVKTTHWQTLNSEIRLPGKGLLADMILDLTFTVLWANLAADDKLMILFFAQRIDFSISWKLSPQFYIKCQSCSLEKRWNNISNCRLLNFLPSIPAGILYKSTAGRYRPVSYPGGPITARCRFIKNAYWDASVKINTVIHMKCHCHGT